MTDAEGVIHCELTAPGYKSGVDFPIGVDAKEAFCGWFEMQLAYLGRWKPGSITSIYERVPAGLKLLLHEVDGHLGLAVHRNEHDDRWKAEAVVLIDRLRKAARDLSSPPPTTEPAKEQP